MRANGLDMNKKITTLRNPNCKTREPNLYLLPFASKQEDSKPSLPSTKFNSIAKLQLWCVSVNNHFFILIANTFVGHRWRNPPLDLWLTIARKYVYNLSRKYRHIKDLFSPKTIYLWPIRTRERMKRGGSWNISIHKPLLQASQFVEAHPSPPIDNLLHQEDSLATFLLWSFSLLSFRMMVLNANINCSCGKCLCYKGLSRKTIQCRKNWISWIDTPASPAVMLHQGGKPSRLSWRRYLNKVKVMDLKNNMIYDVLLWPQLPDLFLLINIHFVRLNWFLKWKLDLLRAFRKSEILPGMAHTT